MNIFEEVLKQDRYGITLYNKDQATKKIFERLNETMNLTYMYNLYSSIAMLCYYHYHLSITNHIHVAAACHFFF